MKTTKILIIAVSVISIALIVLANAGIDYSGSQPRLIQENSQIQASGSAKVVVTQNDMPVQNTSVSSITTVITLFAVLLGMVAFRRSNY